MPRFFWNLEAFTTVLDRSQQFNNEFATIRATIESRPILIATPGELIRMTIILRELKRLHKEMAAIADQFEREL